MHNNDPNQQQPSSGQSPQGPYEPAPWQSPYEQPRPLSGPPPQQPYGPPFYAPLPQPPYGPPVYAPPVYAPPPRKSSLRWLWITLAIIGGLTLISCGACAIIGVASGFTQQISKNFNMGYDSATAANQYYGAIENQDYTTAYSFTAPNQFSLQDQSLTEDTFTKKAQDADTAQGKVTKYVQSNFSWDPNTNTANVTMTVTRNSKSYEVHLVVEQINNVSEITSVDGI